MVSDATLAGVLRQLSFLKVCLLATYVHCTIFLVSLTARR
jgi:hypothetical protein